MRLVIDGRRLDAERTGVGRCLESLLSDWAKTGLPLSETLVVLRDPSGQERVPEVAGLRCVMVGERWPGLAWECLGLGRLLCRDDLLFAPANLIPPTWQGKTVLMMFDTLPWKVPASFPAHVRWRYGWRYRQAARRAERVLVPSRATAADVIAVHGIAADRIRVVYPGPEPSFRPLAADAQEVRLARQKFGLGDAPFFLFVGKRSRRRNVPVILEAFAQHRRNYPAHYLVFVGPSGGSALPSPSQSQATGVIDGGHVAEPILRGLLAVARALLYPSDYEGFGLPVVEALASACPVVTLRNSALSEAGGDAPWYLERPGLDEIAQALRVLGNDDGLRGSGSSADSRMSHDSAVSDSRTRSGKKSEPPRIAFTENQESRTCLPGL